MATKFKIFIADEVYEQLGDIFDYMSNDVASKKFMANFDKSINFLADFPNMYPMAGIKNYRKCNVDKYLVFYSVDEENKSVYVLHIYHGAQDYPKFFKE